MLVYNGINKNPDLILALGYFDGVHIGHKKIIKTLLDTAKLYEKKSAIITFSDNPTNCFRNTKTRNLQTIDDKLKIFENYGVDFVYVLNFEEYRKLSALDYLENILIKNFSPKVIVIGYNHTFGLNRVGDYNFLNDKSKLFNYQSKIVEEFRLNGEKVSSSIIRKLINSGNIYKANEFLGYNFSISNKVIKGNQLARSFNIPTANLNWNKNIEKLPYGVYFGKVQYDNKTYYSLISYSTRPSICNNSKDVLEAHLYDFEGNLYDKEIKVEFIKKYRDIVILSNLEELKNKLKQDYIEFKKWINSKEK